MSAPFRPSPRSFTTKSGLWSCSINGEPGVAIVLAEHVGEGKIGIMPLFVAITPGMDVIFADERDGSGSDGPRRAFASNKEITRPAYHHA